MSDMFQELVAMGEGESLERILIRLLQSEDIELKTEIQKPLNLARLNLLADWLMIENCPNASKMIKEFIQSYLKYMVSHNREGRKEIIQAIAEGMKRDKSLTDKLTTPP